MKYSSRMDEAQMELTGERCNLYVKTGVMQQIWTKNLFFAQWSFKWQNKNVDISESSMCY